MKPNPQRWGVVRRYRAADKRWHTVAPESLDAILDALDAEGESPPPRPDAPLVVTAGDATRLEHDGDAEIELEDGGLRSARGRVPRDLPLGYHRIHTRDATRPLIVAPARAHLPRERSFGFAAQLYSVRSAASWGIGDLADLRELGRWAAGLGARFLLVNPLHAPRLVPSVEPSPYFPSSRCFRNPLYLRVSEVPGAETLGAELEELERAGRKLNGLPLIDHDRVASAKIAALRRVFAAAADVTAVDAALDARPPLQRFALHCALAERHGSNWREWPSGLRHPDSPDVAAAAIELRAQVRFHAWLQLEIERQLHAAEATLPLVNDLAVGVDPGGADAWVWQDVIAPGVRTGAPPDLFNTRGQDWGLPPFDPWKLRNAGYGPFIETLRANLGHAGGLRIDHVMGLRRLWWVPPGAGPAEGAYVRYPVDDLLGIVALESVRAGATVIGEDLGTVESTLRRTLRARGLLSYRLLWFEDPEPRRWPRQALAAVTTHDLPTIAGLWEGSDLKAQERLGLNPNREGTEEIVTRLRRGGLRRDAGTDAAIRHAHAQLAATPSLMVAATLEDVAGVAERPNHPGTTSAQNPNWSQPLPVPLEQLEELPMAGEIAAILSRRD